MAVVLLSRSLYHTTPFLWVCLLAICYVHSPGTVKCSLTPGYSGRACLNQIEMFTCEAPGNGLNWIVSPNSTNSVVQRVTATSDIIPTDIIMWSFTFSYNSDTDTTTSVMTALIAMNLDGALLECRRDDNGQLVGSIIIQIATSPSSPSSITRMIVSSSYIGVRVSLQWVPSADNGGRDDRGYAVTISQAQSPGGSITVRTSTNATESDVDYNTNYTVGVVTTNCAGNSSTATLDFRINGCPTLMDPINGAFGPVANRLQDAEAILQCNSGYGCSVTMVTCQGTDTLMWSPNPASVICTPIPTQPTTAPPMNCTEQCLSIAAQVPTLSSLSTDSTIALSVVISSVLLAILGFLAGLLVMYLITRKKAVYSPTEGQANIQPTVPAGPVYEDVLPAPKEEIELKTNNAYEPVRQ